MRTNLNFCFTKPAIYLLSILAMVMAVIGFGFVDAYATSISLTSQGRFYVYIGGDGKNMAATFTIKIEPSYNHSYTIQDYTANPNNSHYQAPTIEGTEWRHWQRCRGAWHTIMANLIVYMVNFILYLLYQLLTALQQYLLPVIVNCIVDIYSGKNPIKNWENNKPESSSS